MRTSKEIGTPVYLPKGPQDLGCLVDLSMAAFREQVVAACGGFLARPGAEPLLDLEVEVLRLFSLAASQVVAGVVAGVQSDAGWVATAVGAAREAAGGRLRHQGLRATPVRFLGGARILLVTPYFCQDPDRRPGPRRARGAHGREGTGCYPSLEALGIANQATPAFASEVAKQSVRTASFEEARQTLSERGIDLDEKSVWGLTLAMGEEALDERQARVEAARAGVVLSDEFAGRRVVLSADGGRLRSREGGTRGRRGKTGRRRFRTPWCEPKVVMAYVIDEKGRRDRTQRPLYDGTLGNADAAFEILVAELKLRGAARAEEIALTADGAPWIWNRVDDLAEALALRPEQIVKVADFYHAVEHLTNVSELCAGWTDERRKAWVRRMRRWLRAGRIEDVLGEIRGLRRGRNGAKIGTELAYFEQRKDMMRYDEIRARGLPMGSGAVESAIRRIVNLRMKGPAIFWRVENAERILHLRCYLKAGRWRELTEQTLAHRSLLPKHLRMAS